MDKLNSKTETVLAGMVKHSSGLCTLPRDYPDVFTISRHVVELPASCCPVSANPKDGSTLTLRYAPNDTVLEVYSLRALLRMSIGGYKGSDCGAYPAERNMEGMVQLVAQMAADALGAPVRFRAHVNIDTGILQLSGKATPSPCR